MWILCNVFSWHTNKASFVQTYPNQNIITNDIYCWICSTKTEKTSAKFILLCQFSDNKYDDYLTFVAFIQTSQGLLKLHLMKINHAVYWLANGGSNLVSSLTIHHLVRFPVEILYQVNADVFGSFWFLSCNRLNCF